jgi:hypothetical protein
MDGTDDQGIGLLLKAIGGPENQGMEDVDIIKKYFERENIPMQTAMRGLELEVKLGLKFIRQGDTLLGYVPLGQGVVQVHFFTEDKPQEFEKAVKILLSKLKQSGVTTLFDKKIDPQSVKAIQMSGAHVQRSTNPQFEVQVNL